MSTARKIGVLATTVGLTAAGLVWAAGSSSAYAPCTKTVAADHRSASVYCPTRVGGSPTQFRALTYSCKNANGTSCSTTPVYGNYANWGGSSTVYGSPHYIDVNDIEAVSGGCVQNPASGHQ